MRFRIKTVLFLLLFATRIVPAKEYTDIQVLDFDEFEPYLHLGNDTIYVINFWATWCVPCRKELPVFERFHIDRKDKKIRVILVSLDSPSRMENSLIPFLEKNNITAEVLLLNDPDFNTWIDKVDPSWSGSLPATLIYNGSGRLFFEKEIDYELLTNTIEEMSNF
ncbi:MAG: TlpA disulfide reductase family protein [Bacteroidales bacterium]|jgi:thiol-disulfide isomerase/thioredoxin